MGADSADGNPVDFFKFNRRVWLEEWLNLCDIPIQNKEDDV